MKTKINYLLVLVLAGFVLSGCCSMKQCESGKVQQWEYKVYVGDPQTSDLILNGFGKDGWALVSTIPMNNSMAAFYLKRPKQ
jgi:hypothetical protein